MKSKDPLSFEIWIFVSSQTDCDDDHIIFVAMTVGVAFASAGELCQEHYCIIDHKTTSA